MNNTQRHKEKQHTQRTSNTPHETYTQSSQTKEEEMKPIPRYELYQIDFEVLLALFIATSSMAQTEYQYKGDLWPFKPSKVYPSAFSPLNSSSQPVS